MSEISLMIGGTGHPQYPILVDNVTWKTERRGVPGELQFTVVKDDGLGFNEGDAVKMAVDGKDVFYGFVFTKTRDKKHHIKVTAYDQLRYLKNKDTLVYEDLTCAELIKKLAGTFGLNCGTLADTGYKVSASEDEQTLFDMIQNNLDQVVLNKSAMYVLYDDVGKLVLKEIGEPMLVQYLVDKDCIENFDYTSTIDDGVYNKVKLTLDNEETSTRDVYIAKDSSNINRWGLLQYTEKLQASANVTDATAKAKCDALIELHNKVGRSLTVKGALGDTRVRGGSLLPVDLYLGDTTANTWLIVDSVTHKWNGGKYTMDMQLIGGGKFT